MLRESEKMGRWTRRPISTDLQLVGEGWKNESEVHIGEPKPSFNEWVINRIGVRLSEENKTNYQ